MARSAKKPSSRLLAPLCTPPPPSRSARSQSGPIARTERGLRAGKAWARFAVYGPAAAGQAESICPPSHQGPGSRAHRARGDLSTRAILRCRPGAESGRCTPLRRRPRRACRPARARAWMKASSCALSSRSALSSSRRRSAFSLRLRARHAWNAALLCRCWRRRGQRGQRGGYARQGGRCRPMRTVSAPSSGGAASPSPPPPLPPSACSSRSRRFSEHHCSHAAYGAQWGGWGWLGSQLHGDDRKGPACADSRPAAAQRCREGSNWGIGTLCGATDLALAAAGFLLRLPLRQLRQVRLTDDGEPESVEAQRALRRSDSRARCRRGERKERSHGAAAGGR